MHRSISLFLAALCVAAALPIAADTLRRVPLYSNGIYTEQVGTAGLVLRNVHGTSTAEIISCSEGSAFALTRTASGYKSVWHTGYISCRAIAAGDVDGDGAEEVIVGTLPWDSVPGTIHVYTPNGYGPARKSQQIPGTLGISDLAIGNVDGDPALEIVAVTTAHAYVYDAATLTLEWTATGRGGHAVEIGDLEGDGPAEIVISGDEGHVLNGAAQTFKWGYVGGFGYQMALGDIDNDGKAEILGNTGYGMRIVQGDTFATSTLSFSRAVDSIAAGDGNNDGLLEIVIGEDQWGRVRGINAAGTELWYVNNPEHGVSGVAIGDPDGDGINDAVWGAGYTSSGTDSVFVGNTTTHAVKWTTPDIDGPFRTAAADLDGDGDVELVVATSSMGSGYDGGSLQTHDLQGNVTATFPVPAAARIYRVAVGQLDADSALEVAILCENWYDTEIHVFDGITHALQWSTSTDYGSSTGINYNGPFLIRNIDADPVDEIFVTTTNYKIQVLNGASPIVQASTPTLDGYLTSMAIADVNNDSVLDLVAGTSDSYYVFRTSDFFTHRHVTLLGHKIVAAMAGQFAVFSSSGYFDDPGVLTTYDGSTFAQIWECTSLPVAPAMAYAEIGGTPMLFVADGNTMNVYPSSGSGCPAKSVAEHPIAAHPFAGIIDFHFTDLTGDGNRELVLSTQFGFEVDLFEWSSAPRGDADGDDLVIDADMDALTRYFFGDGAGIHAGADANGDSALRPDDLFYLINYRRGTGAAPPQ